MEEALTITQLDPTATEGITQEAQRTGLTIEVVARQLIYRGLEVERKQAYRHRYHDLDVLAGTWSEEEADMFQATISELNRIDPDLWR